MGLIRTVAVDARRRRLPKLAARRVARRTCDPHVRAAQRIVSCVVIETALVERDECGGAAVVLGVAGAATARSGGAVPAVKSGVRGDVGSDRTVAGYAKLRLRGPIKRRVACCAPALEIGVRLRQRPWRYQPLDDRLRLRRADQQEGGDGGQTQGSQKLHAPAD